MKEETRGRKPTLFSQAPAQVRLKQERKRRKAREKDPTLTRIDLRDRDPNASIVFGLKRKDMQAFVELRKKTRNAVNRSKKRLERDQIRYREAYNAYRREYIRLAVRALRERKELEEQAALQQELLELQS